MVVPPDSNDSPTTSAASEQHESELTLNGATSNDSDAVPDLRLEPTVDSSSTLVADDMLLARPDGVPPGAPAHAQPSRVDIFIPDEADRSWLSRLLSLKASWTTKHRRTVHDEPVAMDSALPSAAAPTFDADRASVPHVPALNVSLEREPLSRGAAGEPATAEAISNLEKHLASLAALRNVWTNIDQRLARVEETSGRVEAAVERQLVQGGMARTEQAVADRTLHELSQNIDARLARTEDTLHRSEGVVVARLQELSVRTAASISGVEDTLRLTPQSLADSMLPTIERQIAQAREALERTEQAVADRTLHEVCRTLDARLERTEDMLHRSESLVAEWLQELSARMTARLTETEETIHRIERIVSSRPVEQTPARPVERARGDVAAVVDLRPRARANSENRKPAREVIRTRAALFLSRVANITQVKRPIELPWVTGLAAPVLVLVAALAVGSLFRTIPRVAPESAAPRSETEQTSTSEVPTPSEEFAGPSTPALMANAPRSTGQSLISTPEPRSSERAPAPANSGPRFVGSLSITSVPSGALVSINGKPAGKTPLRLPRQRAGSLAVQIAHDGFERWSAAVLVPADRLTQVSATLRATPRVTRNN